MFEVRPFAEIPAADWDAVVESSPDGWVWALSHWRKLILDVREWGLEDCSFGVYRGDRLVAAMPAQYQAASQKLASTGWGLVGPVLACDVPPTDRPAVLRFVLRHTEALATVKGAARVELGASPLTAASRTASWGVNPFVAFGYEDLSTHTKIVSLVEEPDRIWCGFSENARRKIRRAQKLGFTVRRVDWLASLDRYYEVHCATYRRTGVTPHPAKYFEGIARELAPKGRSVLWAGCSPNGEMVAFRNDARLGEGVLYHTGCSTNDALDSGVNYLLVWEAIQGAIRDGFSWYEVGEVFPAATEGKARSLTEFKSRFGGDLHRYFKASKTLDAARPRSTVTTTARTQAPGPRPQAPASGPSGGTVSSTGRDESVERRIREAYEAGSLYAPSRICLRRDAGGDDYADRLLQDKLDLVAEFYRGGRVVDLCCGAGAHVIDIARTAASAIGVDFSQRYVDEGRRQAQGEGLRNVSFVRADARHLPLSTGSVDFLYCFSALYAIPDAQAAVGEIGRVLAAGGTAVLDFGNRRSMNVFCLRYYTDWPPIHPLTLTQIRQALKQAGLAVLRHRRFQLLPLWAGSPRWLWPLLHPAWKRLFRKRVKGKMLDEWVSSLPGFRSLAFRHVIVCAKTTLHAT